MQKKFCRFQAEIKDRKLAEHDDNAPSFSVLEGTYDRRSSFRGSGEKGIDTVLRYTEEGRNHGATFIDHARACVLNGRA